MAQMLQAPIEGYEDAIIGDQTPPPRDESSDSEFEAEEADHELKVEEAGVEPE
nr:hypothetical protein [Tanacetum cinerariifolium]